MSFFMLRMPAAALRSSPPVSKHTPLPQIDDVRVRQRRPSASSMMRGARCEARPTAWMAGKFCASSSSPAITSTTAPWARAISRATASSSSGPMCSVGVLTRSRTRTQAARTSKTSASNASDTSRAAGAGCAL